MKVAARVALLVLASSIACGGSDSPPSTHPEPDANAAEPAVSGRASLVEALEATGAKVELAGDVEQRFFSVKGRIVKLNGADVQVYEYASDAAAQAEAKKIAPDASQVGDLSVGWSPEAPPHFYAKGRVIALYTGSDSVVTDPLERTLGPQFAGK